VEHEQANYTGTTATCNITKLQSSELCLKRQTCIDTQATGSLTCCCHDHFEAATVQSA